MDMISGGAEPSALELERRVARVVGEGLAREVAEYFEHGARVRPGDVVVDVGANVGAFALAVAARTDGDVTLHCFEAAAPIFAELERHFAGEPLLSRTRHELHPVALCAPEAHGQERPFYYFRRFPTDSTYDLDRKLVGFRVFFRRIAAEIEERASHHVWPARVIGRAASRTLTHLARDESRLGPWLTKHITDMRELRCELASLERVLADRGMTRVDLLKIDVEGAELDVLRGVGDAWPSIARVVVETDSRAGRADAVTQLLRDRGMRIVSSRPPSIAKDGDRDLVLICAER
jgi:FkbM family methyltransferase